MILLPSLLDFKTLDNFRLLQYRFTKQDIRESSFQDHEEIQNFKTVKYPYDFGIIILTGHEEYNEIKFYDNFLLPQIIHLSKDAIDAISAKIDTEFKYNMPERKLFVYDKISELEQIIKEINTNLFYNSLPICDINIQIIAVIEFLYDDASLKNKNPNENKIKLNLSRSEITLLFVLMKQKRLIDHKFNYELGRLIENNFMYYNEKEQVHKEITNVGKLLGDFINGSKTTETASNTLRSIFKDDDFYEIHF